MTDDELPPPPPSQIPRMFAGFATILTINLLLVAILSLLPLLGGWIGAGIGLLQLLWVIPIAVWRFAVKDTPFASGALIGAALTLLLNLGGVALYGFIALCGGF
jgi:hypothetical protein